MWRSRPATAAAAAAQMQQAAGPSRTRGPAQSACGARPPISSKAIIMFMPAGRVSPDGNRAAHGTT